MDLPDVQKGMAILAQHIQRINSSIRQVRLRPGVGYNVRESNGGTSLLINPGFIGGGGGGVASIPCPFECTDASTPEQLKVEVAWGLIWQVLPTGMFPDNDPTLKLNVSETCYIYSRITFNTNTLLPTAIDFSVETDLKQNTSSIQYNLIAVVTIDSEADPIVITSIRNICQQPFPSPCALSSA
jgi:hypothetical protein